MCQGKDDFSPRCDCGEEDTAVYAWKRGCYSCCCVPLWMTKSYCGCSVQMFEKKCKVFGKKRGRFCCCLLRPKVGADKGLGKEMGKLGFLFFFCHVIGCFCSAVIFLVCIVMVVDLVEVVVTLFCGVN